MGGCNLLLVSHQFSNSGQGDDMQLPEIASEICLGQELLNRHQRWPKGKGVYKC